jgi:sugar phosphate isomerase/epimerase
MQFGICTSLSNAPAAHAAGWDYVEESAQSLLQGGVPDDQWQGEARVSRSPLPVPVANMLVPAGMKIVGEEADAQRLRQYMERVTERAKRVGIETLVFGAGGARNVPDGFDRARATRQIINFGKMAADEAAKHGVTIALEPLNRGECNIVNTVAEAMEFAASVGKANFHCLVDSYHLWVEDEPVEHVTGAAELIAHVHVADKDGRLAPGESGTAQYRPLFRVLKSAGYDRRMSVEAKVFEPAAYDRVLEYLKTEWQQA